MSLQKYWQKRDFDATPEPRGKEITSAGELSYFIQRHHARRLHYDFRLELNGTLKSWAVPKGPSFNPTDKRLAVHVEDHPLDYGTFEGDIPAHQYGAGHVVLWDKGVWTPLGDAEDGYAKGNLKFMLDGHKLKGKWALVRMHRASSEEDQDNWLLIKEKDEEAKSGEDANITELRPESVAGLVQDSDKPSVKKKTTAKAKSVTTTNATVKDSTGNAGTKPASSNAKKPKAKIAATNSGMDADSQTVAAMPSMISPQLATLAKHAPIGDEWLSEVKYDGYRALCRIDNGKIVVYTRAGNDWTTKWPPITAALEKLPVDQAWLDGEVVALDNDGNISFQELQNYDAHTKGHRPPRLAYYVFDLLYLNGHDISEMALKDRKLLLQELLSSQPEGSPIYFSDHIVGNAEAVFKDACKQGLEGIVVKQVDAAYFHGRSPGWQKVKCLTQQEFVIAGYTDPEGSRTGFGAIALGVYDDAGKLIYTGRVGTGFDNKTIAELAKKFKPLVIANNPYDVPPTGQDARGVHWMKPELVAEVKFGQWTDAGVIRHAAFVALREDKAPQDIRREVAVNPPSSEELAADEANNQAGKPVKSRAVNHTSDGHSLKENDRGDQDRHKSSLAIENTAPPAKRKASSHQEAKLAASSKTGSSDKPQPFKRSAQDDATVAGVRISHPEKVLFSTRQNTKLELAQYYASVEDWILPHLIDRPLSLVRCPQGGEKQCFFQKHFNESSSELVQQVVIPGNGTYMMANNLEAIIGMVQMGVLELHTWGSKQQHLTKPDRITMDLDPDPALPWAKVIEGAQLVKFLLEEIGLQSFVKTTGGKGLHVVAPIKPELDFTDIKAFSKSIAEHLTKTLPDYFVSVMSKSKRSNKIFLDYLRNGMDATAIAAYSTRSRPDGTISVPIRWEELNEELHADSFNLDNIAARLQSLKEDPWKDYWSTKQRVSTKMIKTFRV